MVDQVELRERLREGIIHGLRMRGWSKIDAENEALDREVRTPTTPERSDGE